MMSVSSLEFMFSHTIRPSSGPLTCTAPYLILKLVCIRVNLRLCSVILVDGARPLLSHSGTSLTFSFPCVVPWKAHKATARTAAVGDTGIFNTPCLTRDYIEMRL
ncbi:hypothetical protein EVAR_51_1 [Eumeta japonica]|uniref:Uncharacterized protein n=1 Tax=Eumeta variegata TaxID=151549 RepID=A0A4C1S7S8_EUMVA|nr:hypothetical protein EVAR_51_1 [Eumeta japonica]